MAYLQADDERKKRKGEKTVAVENWLAGEGGAQFPPGDAFGPEASDAPTSPSVPTLP